MSDNITAYKDAQEASDAGVPGVVVAHMAKRGKVWHCYQRCPRSPSKVLPVGLTADELASKEAEGIQQCNACLQWMYRNRR